MATYTPSPEVDALLEVVMHLDIAKGLLDGIRADFGDEVHAIREQVKRVIGERIFDELPKEVRH